MTQTNPINIAKEKLAEAQLGMIEAYLIQIKNSYKSLPEGKRKIVMYGLERVVEAVENKEEENPFNSSEAKRVRKEAKLSQKKLADNLDTSPQNISRYETGEIPSLKEGTSGRRYIEFLKEKGYDPFNI